MARKRSSSKQPTLFSSDIGDATEPQETNTSIFEGEPNAAVQDLDSSVAPKQSQDLPPAQTDPENSPNARPLFEGVETEPRGLEGLSLRVAAGQRPEPDRERSDGTRPPGTGGSVAIRTTSGWQRIVDSRRGDHLFAKPFTARVSPLKGRFRPSLFDSFADSTAQPGGEEQPGLKVEA